MPSAGTNSKNLDLFLAKTKRHLTKINSIMDSILRRSNDIKDFIIKYTSTNKLFLSFVVISLLLDLTLRI